ncbi:PIG-L family deacetylase [Thermodesulfobacteriota bacterium]
MRKQTLIMISALALISFVFMGCGEESDEESDTETILEPWMTLPELIDAGASILWVGAHGDDEIVASPILSKACRGLGNPCHILVLTRGESGTCYTPPCLPDLVTVRTQEMREAACRYGADLEIHDFTNHPSPYPPIEEVLVAWESEGDPLGIIVETIRRFRSDVILCFDPSHGFYGHTEHQTVGILVQEAAGLAGDPGYGGSMTKPFRPTKLYHLLNRYWFMIPVGWDEGPVDERIYFHEPCPGSSKTCFEEGLSAASAHRSQWPYVAVMALGGQLVQEGLLKNVDF